MTNKERAARAEEAIALFTDYCFEPAGELRAYVGDMLVNMLHLCEERGLGFDEAIERARMHFGYEGEEGG